jgi:hypothetical protein
MKNEREFDTSYFRNTHVQGVNYSLFIMVLKEMMLMESRGQPGAALAASPLLSSQPSDLYGVFRVVLPPRHEITEWDEVYIVGFRSRRSRRVQDCVERTLEGRDGAHHAVSMWDRMPAYPLLILVVSPIDLFFSRSSISQKTDEAKFLGPFDVRRSLKLNNIQK